MGVLVSSGIGGLLDGSGDIEKAITGIGKLRALTDPLLSLSPWLLGAGAGSAAIYVGSRFVKEQVRVGTFDEQSRLRRPWHLDPHPAPLRAPHDRLVHGRAYDDVRTILLLLAETFNQPAWRAFRYIFHSEHLLGWILFWSGSFASWAHHRWRSGRPLTLQSFSVCDEAGRVFAKVTTREALEWIIAPAFVTPANVAALI